MELACRLVLHIPLVGETVVGSVLPPVDEGVEVEKTALIIVGHGTNLNKKSTESIKDQVEAIKAMVDQLAQGPRPATTTKLLAILSEMGDAGVEALDQLALYGDDSARYNALVALSDSDAALATLVSTAFASDASQKEQALSRRVVGRSYADMNPCQAITFLTEQILLPDEARHSLIA